MTIKLRARVWRIPPTDPYNPLRWAVNATARSAESGKLIDPDSSRWALRPSHPEAMQAAYKMLADLDAELMSEVHESRASRRTERCGGCRDLGPHRNVPDCEFYTPPRCECGPGLHSYHCPDHERHRPRTCPSCDDDAHGLGHDNTAPTCTYHRQEPTA